jgi:nucleolar protein 56
LIGEYKKITNLLSKRLREYYSFYFPELNEQIADHKHFAQLVLENKKKLMQKYKIKDSMGKDISKNELNELKKLAKQIVNLFDEKEEKEIYLDKLMKKICPNLLAVATSTVGAQLLSLAGSLRSLVLMPASTIQILGAEKALFRHMTTGAKPPRHGVIVNHPLVSGSHQKEHGKRSRALADKILLAVKLDFFKGEFLGNKLRKELEERFKSSL